MAKQKLTGFARELQEYKSGFGIRGEKRSGLRKELYQHYLEVIEKRGKWGCDLYYRYSKKIILQLYGANYSMTRLDLFGEHALTRVELEEKARDCVLDACLEYVNEVDSGKAHRRVRGRRFPRLIIYKTPRWVREGQPKDVISQKAERKFNRGRRKWRRRCVEDFLDFVSDMRRGIVSFGRAPMGTLESRQRFALKITNLAKRRGVVTALEGDTLYGITVAYGDYKALSRKTGVNEATLRQRVHRACEKIEPWAKRFLGLDSRGRQVGQADSDLDWLWEDSITGGYTSGVTKLHGDEWADGRWRGF